MKMSEARKRAQKRTEEQAEQIEALPAAEADVEAKTEAEVEIEIKARPPEPQPKTRGEQSRTIRIPKPVVSRAEPSEFRNGVGRRKYAQTDLRAVVFKMAGHEYVVDVAQVEEIIRPTELIDMEGTPEYVEGLVKRRGRIVPVVDLRRKLGISVSPPTVETCVIIAKLPIGPVGFLVDSASELMWVKTQDFEVPSQVIAGIDQVYLQGVAHLGDRLLVMLDLERLFTPVEQQDLRELSP